MSFGKQDEDSSSNQSAQGTSNSNSQSYLDPTNEAAQLGNVGNATSLQSSYSPYSGELTAGFNPTQNQYLSQLSSLAGSNVGTGAINQGVSAATGASTYSPNQVQAGQLATTNLSPYMNPYTSSVINSSEALANQNLGTQIQANNANATSSGAFNGTRAADQNALTNEYGQLANNSMIAGLENQNYTQAQGAAQSDIANNLTAQTANQQAGLAGQGLNLTAGQALGSLGQTQLSQATNQAGLLGQAGYAQQTQAQTADTNQYQAWLQSLQNQLGLSANTNSAYGLLGNQVLGSSVSNSQNTSSGSSQGSGSGISFGYKAS